TRFSRDWSSDVCSSDLIRVDLVPGFIGNDLCFELGSHQCQISHDIQEFVPGCFVWIMEGDIVQDSVRTDGHIVPLKGHTKFLLRSEERRVGKEGRLRCR